MRVARRGLCLFAAFSAAVFLAVYVLPAGLWPYLGLALLLPAGLFHRLGRGAGTLICLGAAAALLWCGCFRAVFFSPAQALDGRRSRVSVVLSEEATALPYGALAPGWVVGTGGMPVQATLYADQTLLELGPGDRVSVLCDCDQTALREESRFTDAATRGLFLTLRAQGPLTVERADGVPLWCLPRWWGSRLEACITQAFPQDVAGFLAALVTGDKAGLTTAQRTDLARAGVSHLVAVSGMHICFLVSLLTLLTGYEPRRRALVCIPVLLCFALAVGASPSVVRACLFQLAVLVADLLGREEERWTTLFGALALLLFCAPFSAANISLQLSFSAVAGINLLTPGLYARLRRLCLRPEWPLARPLNRVLDRLWQIVASSIGAIALTTPLAACYFGTVSLLAPLTNLLVLPVIALLFAGALLTGLAGMLFPPLAAAAGWLLAWLGRYVLRAIEWVAGVPYCAVTLENFYYPAALAGLYILGAILFLRRRLTCRVPAAALCGGVLLAGSVLFTALPLRACALSVAALDVGQGQSVVLASKGRIALVDCGGNSRTDPGDVCANYLCDRGVRCVDTLILTHYHADHTSGLSELFRRLRVREAVLPRMECDEETQLDLLALFADAGTAVTWLKADGKLALAEAEVWLYEPLGDGGANEEGASVRVRAGQFAALITGDMNALVEQRLLEHADLGRCQVLIAGHHGADNATSQALLDAIEPEAAVICVGTNTYGHPGDETLERLDRAGVRVHRTDRDGTLTVRVN